jgi:hypothetical protein
MGNHGLLAVVIDAGYIARDLGRLAIGDDLLV